MLGSVRLSATEMEPGGKQAFLPGEEEAPQFPLPASQACGAPLSPPQTPLSPVPPRLHDWSRALMCRHSGWVLLLLNSSTAPLFRLLASGSDLCAHFFFFPLYLLLPATLHTSLILAKPREGGGGGIWRVEGHCSIQGQRMSG